MLRAFFLASIITFTGNVAHAQETPPKPTHAVRKSDLVELIKLDPTIKLDIRYATSNNFVGKPVYPEARAFLQRPAALALLEAHRWLKTQGYGILVHDAYRPWTITKLFWDMTPADKKIFVADPAVGSKHNRGCAVDISLYELASGKAVQMPGDYDEMSERSFVTYTGGTEQQRKLRDLLRTAMERQGNFFVYPEEWWHYDYKDSNQYAVQDIAFSAIHSTIKSKQP